MTKQGCAAIAILLDHPTEEEKNEAAKRAALLVASLLAKRRAALALTEKSP